tara:strand:- start:24 stop:266 length:243 start_codon:yes stop_codon:yes gene_type:complete
MGSTVIPKDCLLCDVCNMQLSDGQFVAIGNSTWYEGWLYCEDCEKKYPEAVKDMNKVLEINEGDDLSNTALAKPIVFESW